MSAHPTKPPVGTVVMAERCSRRKGSLRRATTARPCTLRAVLPDLTRDGRLRRDELKEAVTSYEENTAFPLDCTGLLMEDHGERLGWRIMIRFFGRIAGWMGR